MPKKLLEPRDYPKITIPEQGETIEDALKDVLTSQGYSMAKNGFHAELIGSGEVTDMTVVESNGLIFFKGETVLGDMSAVLDKDTAQGFFSDVLPAVLDGKVKPDQMAAKTRFGILATRTYRDYLCPEIVVLTGLRPDAAPKGVDNQKSENRRSRSGRARNIRRLIVRDKRIGEVKEKAPFTGQVVPDFIQVSGYIRAREGGESDATRQKAKNWEAESTLDMPPFDPNTQERIVPYTKPPGMESLYSKLPTYWRKELNEEAFKPWKGFSDKYFKE